MIELRNISVAFGDKQVLRDFSAGFAKGETVVIMGTSGCGKTTLLRLLLGLKQPEKGVLQGAGKFRCAAVFQEDRLCETLSAVQNVALVHRNEAQIREHLQMLSGGQRRRVALVRAMLFSSDFVIMDEPFKGLDEDTRAAAMAYTVNNKGDRGLILVTHDADEAVYFGGQLIRMEPVAREE